MIRRIASFHQDEAGPPTTLHDVEVEGPARLALEFWGRG